MRQRLVIPNYIVVKSHPSHTDQYSGYAEDTESSALIAKRQYGYFRLASNAQATAIAEAILARYQLDAERGAAAVPMNVGAEVFDYVKITDSRENDNKVGNLGYLTRHYQPGKWEMSFGLGSVAPGGLMGTSIPTTEIVQAKTEALTQAETLDPESIREAFRSIQDVIKVLIALVNQMEPWYTQIETLQSYVYGNILPRLKAIEDYLIALSSLLGPTIGEKRIVYLKVISDDTTLTTGDSKMFFTIPPELSGMDLIDADTAVYTVSSSGLPTIQIANATDGVDMLSTKITIDVSEKTSWTAATSPVIDTTKDDVVTGDQLRVDVDVAGTGTKGLDIILVFQLP